MLRYSKSSKFYVEECYSESVPKFVDAGEPWPILPFE